MCGSSGFSSDSNVILLSVDISTLLSLVFKNFKFSSALSIDSCSAWLFEHLPFNLYFFVSVNIAIPDPTPCSLLLPSVYTCMFLCCLLDHRQFRLCLLGVSSVLLPFPDRTGFLVLLHIRSTLLSPQVLC